MFCICCTCVFYFILITSVNKERKKLLALRWKLRWRLLNDFPVRRVSYDNKIASLFFPSSSFIHFWISLRTWSWKSWFYWDHVTVIDHFRFNFSFKNNEICQFWIFLKNWKKIALLFALKKCRKFQTTEYVKIKIWINEKICNSIYYYFLEILIDEKKGRKEERYENLWTYHVICDAEIFNYVDFSINLHFLWKIWYCL